VHRGCIVFFIRSRFLRNQTRAKGLRALSMYMLVNLNRWSDAPSDEFVDVNHMLHLNPVANGGIEHFDLSPKP
jgi:hypothetical protein